MIDVVADIIWVSTLSYLKPFMEKSTITRCLDRLKDGASSDSTGCWERSNLDIADMQGM
jgi:hypothetical protein